MLDRRWMHHLALGVALTIAFPALGQDTSNQQKRPDQQEETGDSGTKQASDQPAVEPRAAVSNDAAPPTNVSADSSEGNQQAEENAQPDKPAKVAGPIFIGGDTLAQWIMAIAGIIAVGISGWAVWLLWKTLKATRDMITEAERTTRAAEETTAVARDTLNETRISAERQLRAYISFIRVETLTTMDHRREDRPRKVDGYALRITIENAGHTPAIDCLITASIAIVDASSPDEPVFRKPEDDGNRTAIGPKSMVYGPNIGFYRAEAQQVVDGNSRIFVRCRAEYRDIFENSPGRFTEKTWEVFITENPDILMPGDPLPSFSFKGYGQQLQS